MEGNSYLFTFTLASTKSWLTLDLKSVLSSSLFFSVLVVTRGGVEEDTICRFIHEYKNHSSCRFLVYSRPHLGNRMLFSIGRVASVIAGTKPGHRNKDEDDESGWSLAGCSDSWFILSPTEHWIRVKLVLAESTEVCWRPSWSKTHAKIESLIEVVLQPKEVPLCEIFGEFLISITSKPDGGEFRRHSIYEEGRCPFDSAGRALHTPSQQSQLQAKVTPVAAIADCAAGAAASVDLDSLVSSFIDEGRRICIRILCVVQFCLETHYDAKQLHLGMWLDTH